MTHRKNSENLLCIRISSTAIDTAGGYRAEYADTGEPYESHECYIDGILCDADEGHFGGIVIQPV